jgi:hypothetical protein
MSAQLTHKETQARTTEPAATGGHGRLREAYHRIRLAMEEMSYGSRRIVERQAPWTVDPDWHRG